MRKPRPRSPLRGLEARFWTVSGSTIGTRSVPSTTSFIASNRPNLVVKRSRKAHLRFNGYPPTVGRREGVAIQFQNAYLIVPERFGLISSATFPETGRARSRQNATLSFAFLHYFGSVLAIRYAR